MLRAEREESSRPGLEVVIDGIVEGRHVLRVANDWTTKNVGSSAFGDCRIRLYRPTLEGYGCLTLADHEDPAVTTALCVSADDVEIGLASYLAEPPVLYN